MMNYLRILVLLVATLAAGAARADFSGLVVGVLDGDTVDVLVDKTTIRVRLAEIDAPEKAQPFGTRARQALAGMVFKQPVTVQTAGQDRYGRTLGTISAAGVNINRRMVSEGMAWAYLKYVKDRSLIAEETAAKAAARGLWADPSPVPPWEWRASKRGLQQTEH
jgi:micrococcal nuclease